MATELGQAYVQIMPSAKGISGKITKAIDPEAKSAGKSAGSSIASGIKKIIVAAGIGKVITSAVTMGGDLQQSLGGVETLFKDDADKMKGYANDAYRTVGVSANEYMEQVTSFSASLLQSLGGDTEKAADKANIAMIDMGDNANKMGTDMRDIQNAYQGFAKQNYTMLDNLKLGYGGTKGEMERLLKDAQKLSGVKYNINNLSDVYEAIHVIQNEIGITGTTAKEAEETLTGSANAMKSAFKDVLGAMAIGEDWGPAFDGFTKSLVTFTKNLFPMVSDVIKGLPLMIVALIRDAGPELLNAGLEAIASLVSGIGRGLPDLIPRATEGVLMLVQTFVDNIPMLVQSGLDLIVGLAQGIMNAIPMIIEKVPEIINNLITALIESIPLILDAGVQLFTSLIEGLPTIITNIVDKIPEIINGIINMLNTLVPQIIEAGVMLLTALVDNLPIIIEAVVQAIPKIVNALVDYTLNNIPLIINAGIQLLTALVTALPQIIMTIVQAIPQIINSLVNTLRNRWPDIKQAGVDLFTSLIKSLPQIITTTVKAIPQIISGIVSAFKQGMSAIAGVGLDLVKGLWNGIKNAGTWLKDKIKGWAKDIIGSVKGVFGIKSPSKVFSELGGYLDEGLAIGITDNTKPITKAMGELGELTTLSFNNAMPSPALAGAGNEFTPSNGFNMSELIAAINNLAGRDNVIAINGREIARQTVGDMSVELYKLQDRKVRG